VLGHRRLLHDADTRILFFLFLYIGALFRLMAAWFAILVTGRYRCGSRLR
jgi:hypothetical protein